MPRSYRLGQRQLLADQTRARIVEAARTILVTAETYANFSIDAVARQADVARMTVYHQFGSKLGLLEALCDSLAASGGMEHLAAVFRSSDLRDALDLYIAAFSRFWGTDRKVIRRLNAFALFDPDFGAVIQARNERRRHGLRVLIERYGSQLPPPEREEMIAMLFTLTSFECFDILAGTTQEPEEVAPQIIQLANMVIDHNRI
ncbi:MAG: TetR/AcrR family transcriptional regulator [Ktedonobacterales bacterium]